MTPTRAARQADTTCAELDQLAALLFGGPTVKDPRAHYANLRRQIHAAISRDNITAGIDGYRSRHGSTDGGGNSDSTPVEAAALRLVEGGQPADIVHAKVTLIVASVHSAWRAANGWDNALRLIPTQGAPTGEVAVCSHCRERPGEAETTVNGMLDAAYFLCGECFRFVERQYGGKAGRHGYRLPNKAELDAMRSGRKPRARLDPTDRVAVAKWRDGSTTGLELRPPNPAA